MTELCDIQLEDRVCWRQPDGSTPEGFVVGLTTPMLQPPKPEGPHSVIPGRLVNVLWDNDTLGLPPVVQCSLLERVHGKIVLAEVQQTERGWPWAYVEEGMYYCARCKHPLPAPDRNDNMDCSGCGLPMQVFPNGVRISKGVSWSDGSTTVARDALRERLAQYKASRGRP